MRYWLLLLLVFGLCYTCEAEYKAVDGDSLVHGEERIRLQGIDAPELYQTCFDENASEYDCGKKSLSYLQDLIKGNKVYCKCLKKRDRYKRKLCECFVSTLSLNREMVASGHAISYKNKKLAELENEAREHKYGIWRGKFMRPAIFRALERANNPQNKRKSQ